MPLMRGLGKASILKRMHIKAATTPKPTLLQ